MLHRLALPLVGMLIAAPALAQSAEDHFNAGVAAFTNEGNPVKARAALEKALEADKSHAPSHFNLALLDEEAERWADALEHYRAYVTLAPADDLYLGVARNKIATLSKFIELDATPAGRVERIYLQLVQRAQAKLAAGDVGAALALAEIATTRAPGRFEGQLAKGVALAEAERYEEAQSALGAAKGAAPASQTAVIDALLKRAQAMAKAQGALRGGDEALAAKAYAKAAERYAQAWTIADVPTYGFQAARAWVLADEPQKAGRIYDALAGSSDTAVAGMAAAERARLTLLATRSGTASAEGPALERARRLTSQGKAYEADAELTQLLEPVLPDRSYAGAFEARAAARMAMKEYAGAVRDLSFALLLDPSRGPTYEQRAGAFAALGQMSNAVADIDQAIARQPAAATRLRALRQQYLQPAAAK